jgi:hypothetical protein
MSETLYIYTKRDNIIDKQHKFEFLIPRLFGNKFNNDVIKSQIMQITNNDYKDNCIQLFKKMLVEPENSLNKSIYINKDDISKIMEINIEIFSKLNNVDCKNFIDYLLSGYTMEYGLYFSIVKTSSVEKLKELLQHQEANSNNNTIIYFMELTKFLDYIDEMYKLYKFNTNIVYFTNAWLYGKRKEGISIEYKKNQHKRNDNKTNNTNTDENKREQFIKFINDLLPLDILRKPNELICNIPLPNSLFENFNAVYQSGGKYKQNKTKNIRLLRKYNHKTKKQYKQKHKKKM